MRATLTTDIEVPHGDDNYYPRLAITFDYSPGRPAFTPRGEYAPIDPPDPPEVGFVTAELLDRGGLPETDPRTVQDWAQKFLDTDAGFDEACDAGEAARRPDPDERYERMRDEGF